MTRQTFLFAVLGLVAVAVSSDPVASDQPPAAKPVDGAPDAKVPAKRELRQPGFVFVELDCRDLESYIGFLQSVAGFEVVRKDGAFVVLESDCGQFLLNGVNGKAGDKPIRYQGPRVEIGIVVKGLDQSFAEAKKFAGWTIQAGIAKQSWGVRDFRVYSPDQYYLRVTEGPQ